MMIGRIALAFALAGALPGTVLAQAATPANYSALYVFGDSLSDRGNLADALGHHFPTPPFYHDSFTNGDTAVQVLAQRFGLNADASLFPTGFVDVHNLGYTSGTNYAVAGATAGTALGQGVTGLNLSTQVGAFLARQGGVVPTSSLVTVFIGGNDVRTAAHQGMTGADGIFTYNASYITDGITAELGAISTLLGRGAMNLLVVNVPDVGVIPEFTTYSPAGQAAAATAASQAYNMQLASGIASLVASNQSANIKLFDLYSYSNYLAANAASLGITNTTQPCYLSYDGVTNTPATSLVINPACGPIDPNTGQAANIGQFQYWDAIHPTAKVQAAFGNALGDFVTGVPEPDTWAMMLVGVGLVGFSLRRRRAKVAVTGPLAA
jgi:outer membrane lipase/esterase